MLSTFHVHLVIGVRQHRARSKSGREWVLSMSRRHLHAFFGCYPIVSTTYKMEYTDFALEARQSACVPRVKRPKFQFSGEVNFPLATTMQTELKDWESMHGPVSSRAYKPPMSVCPFATAGPFDRFTTMQASFMQEAIRAASHWPPQPIVHDPHLDTFRNIQGGFRRSFP